LEVVLIRRPVWKGNRASLDESENKLTIYSKVFHPMYTRVLYNSHFGALLPTLHYEDLLETTNSCQQEDHFGMERVAFFYYKIENIDV